jgi:hypothetical protein
MTRGRRYYREDSFGGGGLAQVARLFVGAVVLLALGAAAVAYYATTIKPERHKVEKVFPDDRFPR